MHTKFIQKIWREKGLLGRSRHRWSLKFFKVNLEEIGYEVIDWIQLAQDRV